jgi:serine/threonine protein kinase
MTDRPDPPAPAAFEFLGELGPDDTGRKVFLARDRTTELLVAVRVEPSAALTVIKTLDHSVPSGLRSCPICGGRVGDWRSYCSHCGSDIAGVSAAAGIPQRSQVEQMLQRAGGSVDVLGEMRRADNGAPVCFGRDRRTGEIVALSIHASNEAAGQPFDVLRTIVSQALSSAPVLQTPAQGDVPATSGHNDGSTRQCPSCERRYDTSVRFCPHDGSVLRALGQSDDLLGQVIADRYHILEKIGQGGMGLVYLAEHVKMGRRCAIKVMHRNLSPDLSAISRFGREAANASRVNHPNVATIYDFGETKDNLVYLAMEYVEGEALARLMERGEPIAAERAVGIARQIADALDAAHRQRVVHRDLKPDNILIGRDHTGRDVVKVVDFGIAKAMLGDGDGLTRTGAVIGTPRYMSPEQLIAEPIDGRSDIYSLGCILYELLVGDRPFGDRPIDMPRRLTEPPPHARERNASIPAALDAIVVRAMARKPDERYQTAADLRDALGADFTEEAVPRTARGFLDSVRNRSRSIPKTPAQNTGQTTGPAARGPGSLQSEKVTASAGKSADRNTAPTQPVAAGVPASVTDQDNRVGSTAPRRVTTQPQRAEKAEVPFSYAQPQASSKGQPLTRMALVAVVVLVFAGAGTALVLSLNGGADEGGDANELPGLTSGDLPAPGTGDGGGVVTGGGPGITGGGAEPAGGGGPSAGPEGVGRAGTGGGEIRGGGTGGQTGGAVAGAGGQTTAGGGSGNPPAQVPPRLLIQAQLPPGATVFLNGRALSPFDGSVVLKPDTTNTVEIRAEGYVTASWTGTAAFGDVRRWTPTSQRELPPQPPPPPPPRDFAGAVDSITNRFRTALQSGNRANLSFARMPSADTEELVAKLGSSVMPTVRPGVRDSANGRVEFIVTIRNESGLETLIYIADIEPIRTGGWRLNSIIRQRR